MAYYSKKLTSVSAKYPTHERELMAIVVAIKKWRHYVDSKCTHVVTNHEPLEHLQTQHQLSSHQVRWLEFLQMFKLGFVYHPG